MRKPTRQKIWMAETRGRSWRSLRLPDYIRAWNRSRCGQGRYVRWMQWILTMPRELGCTIRQISRADLKGDTLFAEVGPCLVRSDSPFGRVQRNLNLVLTSGQYGGDMAFLGAGAGGDPTAVAVVSDVKFVAESLSGGRRKNSDEIFTAKISCDFETAWYLRFFVRDQPGIVARLAQIMAGHRLNIDSLLQKPGFDKASLPFVITLEPCRDSMLHPALEEMMGLDFALRPTLCLPILK